MPRPAPRKVEPLSWPRPNLGLVHASAVCTRVFTVNVSSFRDSQEQYVVLVQLLEGS